MLFAKAVTPVAAESMEIAAIAVIMRLFAFMVLNSFFHLILLRISGAKSMFCFLSTGYGTGGEKKGYFRKKFRYFFKKFQINVFT